MSMLPRAMRGARRAWPLVLMAWERWQTLPPDKKEEYKRHARQYAERGRKLIDERRKRRPR
jgi:TRAP-type C4-dicarboxylate transport system substrate-binding protein